MVQCTDEESTSGREDVSPETLFSGMDSKNAGTRPPVSPKHESESEAAHINRLGDFKQFSSPERHLVLPCSNESPDEAWLEQGETD